MKLSEMSWDAFHGQDLEQKGACLREGIREEHVLVAQQFDRDRLNASAAPHFVAWCKSLR